MVRVIAVPAQTGACSWFIRPNKLSNHLATSNKILIHKHSPQLCSAVHSRPLLLPGSVGGGDPAGRGGHNTNGGRGEGEGEGEEGRGREGGREGGGEMRYVNIECTWSVILPVNDGLMQDYDSISILPEIKF